MEGSTRGGRYTQLSEKDSFRDSEEFTEAGNIPSHHSDDRTHRYRFLITIATTLLIILSTVQLVLTINLRFSALTTKHLQPDPDEPCGQVAAEAQARGCIFDYGLVSWVPPHCYDKDLDEAFRAREPFEFYYPNEDDSGPDFSSPITSMELLAGNPRRSWTTFRFHVAHCLHSWQYMHKAVDNGRRLSKALEGFGHTTHCSGVAMNDTVALSEIVTKVTIDFPACVRFGAVAYKD